MVAVDGDLELEIISGTDDYIVRVISAPAGGETSGGFQLDVEDILAKLPALEHTVLASTVTARRTIPVAEKPLHEVGERLFQALFSGPVHGTYRASLGASQHSGRPLRVVLRLAAPELAALPWELLFDPETGSYLCHDMPLLRHIPSADFTPDPLDVEPPLRILGIAASPRDQVALDAEKEKQKLAEALEDSIAAGLIELAWARRATWEVIQNTLLKGPWHVLHFIGHGDYDPHGQEGRVALESLTGQTDMVRASTLMQLLREAEPTPRLVVLNSCSSGETGTKDLFSGTAAALVRGGISAVAAMQFTVTDDAAIAFARGFYGAIAHGRDIDKAIGSGRRSIMGRGTLEWVTPVLYVRGGSTRLFTLTHAPAPIRLKNPLPLPPTPDVSRDQVLATQLQTLYLEASAQLRMKQYGTAISLLEELLNLEPGYRDAVTLRDKVRQRQESAKIYRVAREAEAAGDWEGAARGFAVIEDDPEFGDAAARRKASTTRQRVTDLQNELRIHAGAGNWQAVLDTGEELRALDPAAANPDGLTRRAIDEILFKQARPAEDSAQKAQAQNGPIYDGTKEPGDTGHYVDRSTAKPPQAPDTEQDRQSVPAGSRKPGSRLLEVYTGSPIRVVAFSPDGTRLATGSPDKTARIWNAVTGEHQLRLRHEYKIRAVAFSPDGTRLATGSDSNNARIWDTHTGSELIRLKIGPWIYMVFAVTFAPDGRRLATGDNNNNVRIWDTRTGAELLKVMHEGAIRSLAFSPDGTRLATGSDDKTVRIWNVATGEQQLRVRHDGKIRSVAFSPDGTCVAFGSDNNDACVWDTRARSELVKVKVGSWINYANVVAFSPDGTRIATGSSNNTARIWDTRTGAERLKLTHEGPIHAVAFSPDGTRLATGSDDKTVRIWDIAGR